MDLQLPVRRIMTAEPVTVRLGQPLSRVRDLLRTHPFHHVPVVSERGGLVGVLSSLDLARVSLDAWVKDEATVDAELDAAFDLRGVMTHEPVTVGPDDSIRLAAERMGDGDFHSLPVVDREGRLVGILTSTDLLRHFAAHWS